MDYNAHVCSYLFYFYLSFQFHSIRFFAIQFAPEYFARFVHLYQLSPIILKLLYLRFVYFLLKNA